MGARSLNIAAIHIENAEGERFPFVNNYPVMSKSNGTPVSNEGHNS